MSYALIDNASLTAIERVLGDIVVKNPDTVNGDLVAFENLVQAILFYDDLICVDNYKPKYKKSRKEKFDFIRFLDEEEINISELDQLAESQAQQIKPEIRGGEFADDDFKELVEMLKLNMVCTWDMRSSVYYLTMKMLGQPDTPEYEKYSELSSAIFNELSDVGNTRGYWSKDVKLVSSSGHEFTRQDFREEKDGKGGVTRSLEMFVASLNWLAYKSIYYSIVAKHLKADSFIHPIRHAYQLHWMKKTGAFGHDFTARVINNLSDKISTTTSEIVDHGRSTALSLDLPIFSAWLSHQGGGIEHAISSALEIKGEDQFSTARQIIREIRATYDEEGIAEGNKRVTKLQNNLDKIVGDIKREYGVPSAQGISGSFLIKSINSVTAFAGIPALPDKEVGISTPKFLRSKEHKAFATVFKDVTNELTSIERLGGVRDLMARSFVIDDEYYLAPKTEDPNFRRVSSGWKLPM